MNKKILWIIAVCLIGVIVLSLSIHKQLQNRQPPFRLDKRPQLHRYVFDYARILEDHREYINRYLEGMKERYSIEAVIVSLPAIEQPMTIEELTVTLLNNWQIGKENDGRGVLLMLLEDKKQVKLEVSLELEDVFTDAFSGYIEDMQLRPYFLSGQIGLGLAAVMEELEIRAQLKHQGGYTGDVISGLDRELLSGGAGAKRDLTKFQKEIVKDMGDQYPAGKTPQAAWQTLLRSWRNKVRDPNLGIYTEIAKLDFRDFQNKPDSAYERDFHMWGNKPFEVVQNEDYAVIFFGNKEGWDNAPFLLCRTPEGWKFDLVHQRKIVRMGRAPLWGIERFDHPYIDLLSKCPYFMSADMPLEKMDQYRVEDDEKIAEEIGTLEKEFKNNPNNFDVAMELGKLNVITSRYPKHTFPILKKAKELNPESSLPYRYLAIQYVDSSFQYENAIEEIREYIKIKPQDPFGYNFLGFCYLSLSKYDEAIQAFEKTIQLDPNNSYAYCKLSRCYINLFLNASKLDFRRSQYKKSALEMFEKAKNVATTDTKRLAWLYSWLVQKGVISEK